MVVIAGGDTYLQPRGVILVVAAESGEPRLQIGGIAGDSVFVDRSIKGMQTFDYDKDGVDDLVVLTRGHGNSAYGVRLHVFSLLTGERLWQSPSIGGSSAWSSGMAVVPATATQPALLIAGLQTSLRAYNTETGLQEWNHPVSNMLFTYNHDAAGGAEFVLIDTDGIVTHLDASTREVLRTYELGGIARSLVPLPGSDALLVQLDGRLRVLEGGEEVAVTPLLGAGYVMASAVVPHGSRYLIAASTTFGYLMLEYDPAGVFADGFD
jgi:outer membrane protein assembly factor BamB